MISPNEEAGSLKIFQEAWVWSSVFTKGHQAQFQLQHGNKAWLHVGRGEIEVNGQRLVKGDALAITQDEKLSITGRSEDAEFLILELGA
ncbi:MAG: hypothetical protein ACK5Y2_07965 [Bdellovibrionales bacterium]